MNLKSAEEWVKDKNLNIDASVIKRIQADALMFAAGIVNEACARELVKSGKYDLRSVRDQIKAESSKLFLVKKKIEITTRPWPIIKADGR